MGVSQRGDWKNWLLFMLRAVENTSNQTFNKINDIVSAKDSILDTYKERRSKITKSGRIDRCSCLLSRLLK